MSDGSARPRAPRSYGTTAWIQLVSSSAFSSTGFVMIPASDAIYFTSASVPR